MKEFIVSGRGLPTWESPISHAVVAGNMCFVSGQLSVNTDGEYVEGTIREEAERAFANVFAALDAAGFSRDDLVFVDIAFADLANLAEVNELYGTYFPEGRRPARTIYQAAALPYGGKVKVMGTAVRD